MTRSIKICVASVSRRTKWDGSYIRRLVGSSMATVVLVGCSQADHSPTGPSLASKAQPEFAISVTQPSGRPKTQDEIFADIATHVPGYAGTYYDHDGTPITNLVDLSKSAAAEQAIAPLIRSGRDGAGSVRSQFRKVAYNFLQLKQWKDYATSTILSRPNVVFVDIDEANNRISIGVRNAAEIAPVKRLLDDKHIPGLVGALIPIDTSPNPQVSPGGPETLRNTQSLIGGVMIGTGAFYDCTLSFNAQLVAGNGQGYYRTYSSDHFFVTNTHCMNQVGAVTNTAVFQTTTNRIIGYEYRQPNWQGSNGGWPQCPNGSLCATAETALIRYQVPWGGSKIARTTFFGTLTDTGSTAIDPYNPPWQVVDSVGDATLLQGRTLQKVGWHAGWTQGSVTQTCTDYRLFIEGNWSPYVILCSWSANLTSIPGDSGAPVFMTKLGSYGNQVQLVGTIWAGTYGVSSFSFYPYISWELTGRDTQLACGSVSPCWPRLGVSGL